MQFCTRLWLVVSLLISMPACGLDGVDGDDGSNGSGGSSGEDGTNGSNGTSGSPLHWGTRDTAGVAGDGVVLASSDLGSMSCDGNSLNEIYQVMDGNGDGDGVFYCDGASWILGWSDNDGIFPFDPVIADLNFRKCLNLNLSKGIGVTQDLTIAELQSLTGTLDCSNFKIADLSGIQNLTKINAFDFSNNSITVIPAAFASLVSLVSIDFSENEGVSLVDANGNLILSDGDLLGDPNDANMAAALLTKTIIVDSDTNDDMIETLYRADANDGNTTTETVITDGSNYFHLHWDAATALLTTTTNYIQDVNFRKCIHAYQRDSRPSEYANRSNTSEFTYAELETVTGTLQCQNRSIRSLAGVGELRNIKTLDLSKNLLSEIPNEIRYLTLAERFDVSNNQLRFLNNMIRFMTTLTSFDASSNKLESVTTGIQYLTVLKTLNLSNNILTELPSEISALDQLTTLDVSSNKLTAVASAIKDLVALQSLDMHDNLIETLPSLVLTPLTELLVADFSDNTIETVPAEIALLTKLTSLNLKNNHVSYLPLISLDTAGLDSLTNLVLLDISDNYWISGADQFDANTTNITDANGLDFSSGGNDFNIRWDGNALVIIEGP